jgi:hypothetical protein
MIRFRATEDQLGQILANAVNNSKAVGLGLLHETGKVFTKDDFDLHSMELDYVQGRMVKLGLREKNGFYFIYDDIPRIDWQSWASKYPTYESLLNSVGIIEFEIDPSESS